jgi:uridine kinase
MKRRFPMVISVAAVSGGGKTTIASCLKEKLPNSKTLYFDDYDFDGPEDIIKWIDNGCNPNKWDLSPLIRDIKKLHTEPLDYIILDFPFAYLHNQTSKLIDFAVFIDTPLDIAMARRIIRDFKNGSTEDILVDLDNYISRGRKGYLALLNTTKPNSDLVVDGTLSKSDVSAIIAQHIAKKRDE